LKRSAVPDLPHLRVYLDSNILISASLNERSGFLEFWQLPNITVVTSHYAIGEVTRNLFSSGDKNRFEELLTRSEIISDGDVQFIPSHIRLATKDAPILAAAIFGSVDYLATGDKNHFKHLYGTSVSGVYIISPADFLALHRDRQVE
jgi:predicted nucleic acid-binding protein